MAKLKDILLKLKIGFRTTKTAIAVIICYLIMDLWLNRTPFYACVAAVVSMQNSFDNSFKAASSRMIGTIIGGIYGVLLVYAGVNFITIGIGMILLIHTLNLLKYSGAIATGAIVYFSVAFFHSDNTIIFSIHRILETFLGIIVALVVNWLIAPPANEY